MVGNLLRCDQCGQVLGAVEDDELVLRHERRAFRFAHASVVVAALISTRCDRCTATTERPRQLDATPLLATA